MTTTTRRALLATSAGAAITTAATLTTGGASPATAGTRPRPAAIWRHEEIALLLVDYQPEMFAGLQGADPRIIELKARLLAKLAIALDIPVVLTTVGVAIGINRPTVPTLRSDLPDHQPIDRSTMDAWEDPAIRRAIKATGRRRLVIAGLYSEICVAFPTVHAIQDGYHMAFVGDAIAGQSPTAHEMAIARMIQAGAVPTTAVATALESFRDWNTPEAAKASPILAWHDAELAAMPANQDRTGAGLG